MMLMMKLIFITGTFFHRGHCWEFWCLTHTDSGECAECGVCSVVALCQTYSSPPIHYHRVHIQHEQDKLLMCQLPGNVWVKILDALAERLKFWHIFNHLFIYRVKTFSQQVNLVNATTKSSIYKQFIQPFLSTELSGAVQFKSEWCNANTKWK